MKRTISLIMILAFVSSCSGGNDPGEKIIDMPTLEARSYDVHIFYYPWYRNPQVDGEYLRWTGTPSGDPRGSISYEGGVDIASSFFPAYGPYSSADPNIIKSHIDQIAAAKIGTICVSWWDADSLAAVPVMGIMDSAAGSNLKVCFRIEVSEGVTAAGVMRQVRHLTDTYGGHKAFYISDRFGNRPIFYIGSSWIIDRDEWASFLTEAGTESIRGTKYDALFIGVWKDEQDGEGLEQGGFDGFYTWFAAKGASWGSDFRNFEEMNLFSMDSGLFFIPTVSPGFDDTRIHPWNRDAVEIRGGGSRYMQTVQNSLKVQPPFITVNSFNNWLEGTQIEPATAMATRTYKYSDYGAQNEFLYLKLSSQWVGGFSR